MFQLRLNIKIDCSENWFYVKLFVFTYFLFMLIDYFEKYWEFLILKSRRTPTNNLTRKDNNLNVFRL